MYHRQQEERERQAQLRGAPTMDPDIAATRIQKVINCAIIINYNLFPYTVGPHLNLVISNSPLF